jgi:hypothetical protein
VDNARVSYPVGEDIYLLDWIFMPAGMEEVYLMQQG